MSFYLSRSFCRAIAEIESIDEQEVNDELADRYKDQCLDSARLKQSPPFKFQVLPYYPGITDPEALPLLDKLTEQIESDNDND